MPMQAIPVTVLGGYLGAGKTTLVNQLLRRAGGLRIAVLVNDFGDIGIDADLIESSDGDVINLSGGCVCCSFGSDLMAALMRLPQMEPRPDRVLIETSGVALPRAVGRTVTLVTGLALDAVVVVADAETLRDRAADRYVGDTVQTQLRDADLVLLNKIDLCTGGAVERLHGWLRDVAPRAAVIDTERGAVAIELLFGGEALTGRAASRATSGLAPPPAPHAGAAFDTLSWTFDEPVDAKALADALASPELGLARAKGFVTGRDGGGWLVQAVGRRVELSPRDPPPAGGGRLACIGARGRFDRSAIEASLRRAGPGRAQARARVLGS